MNATLTFPPDADLAPVTEKLRRTNVSEVQSSWFALVGVIVEGAPLVGPVSSSATSGAAMTVPLADGEEGALTSTSELAHSGVITTGVVGGVCLLFLIAVAGWIVGRRMVQSKEVAVLVGPDKVDGGASPPSGDLELSAQASPSQVPSVNNVPLTASGPSRGEPSTPLRTTSEMPSVGADSPLADNDTDEEIAQLAKMIQARSNQMCEDRA